MTATDYEDGVLEEIPEISVSLTVNGRRAATDNRVPFRVNLHFKQKATVRARVATSGDQVVAVDRTVRACS